MVSCSTKVIKSVWAGLLLRVIHYFIARVRFPVHKANLDIVEHTVSMVALYLLCSSSLVYNPVRLWALTRCERFARIDKI